MNEREGRMKERVKERKEAREICFNDRPLSLSLSAFVVVFAADEDFS